MSKTIETWKVKLSGLIYDMVNKRPSNQPYLKGAVPNFKDIEKLVEYEIAHAKQEVLEEAISLIEVHADSIERKSPRNLYSTVPYDKDREDGLNAAHLRGMRQIKKLLGQLKTNHE